MPSIKFQSLSANQLSQSRRRSLPRFLKSLEEVLHLKQHWLLCKFLPVYRSGSFKKQQGFAKTSDIIAEQLTISQQNSNTVHTGLKKAHTLFLIQVCPTAFTSGVWSVGALEVSTGKVSSIEAMNGSTVLLPCTYSSCIGIKNLYFSWHFNDNGTMNKVWFLERAEKKH